MTLTDYSTRELERLTTGAFKGGEYTKLGIEPVLLRLSSGVGAVDADGNEWRTNRGIFVARRVRSFTDATELDPPQDAMLTELARRKACAAFAVGDRVQYSQNADATFTVTAVGERSLTVSASGVFWGSQNPTRYTKLPALRYATDAEVAAYHRAHCVPAPTPISNATHAGRRVRHQLGNTGIVVNTDAAKRLCPTWAGSFIIVVDNTGQSSWWSPALTELLP